MWKVWYYLTMLPKKHFGGARWLKYYWDVYVVAAMADEQKAITCIYLNNSIEKQAALPDG